MMIRIYNYIYTTILIFSLALFCSGCVDDTFRDFNMEYGEGEADLKVKVAFENLSPALDTRAAGNAIGPVDNLQMVIYRVENGNTSFHKRVVCNDLPDYKLTSQGNSAEPSDKETGNNQLSGGQFESTGERTDHAEFSIQDLPYGVYKIYAVANVPGLTDEQCKTEESLKSIQFAWNPDVAANNAMFGYFTREPRKSSDFDAPLVLVNAPNVDIHSWIKRLASKVTVAFDPSGLKEAVTVYIKSVTIHDIPDSCRLGVKNTPGEGHIIHDGETINYFDAGNEKDYTKWKIKLQKGSGMKGSNHSNTDNALFFFENMQGNYPGQKDYLKEQIPEETGNLVDTPVTNPDGSTNDYKDRIKYGTYIEVIGYYVSKNSEKMSSGNIKYRFMLGKDIMYDYNAERNYHYKLTLKLRGFANEADWHISYVEPTPSLYTPDQYYISYLYGQESYLPVRVITDDVENSSRYTLVAEIIENPWWPTDEDNNVRVTVGRGNDPNGFAWMKSAVFNLPLCVQGVLSSPMYKAGKEHVGNKDEYTYAYDATNNDRDYVGFLSLRKPEMANNKYTDIEFPGVTDSHSYGANYNAALKTYYYSHNVPYAAYSLEEGKRNVGLYENGIFTTGSDLDGKYEVSKDQDGSITLKVPMYTRPLKMVAGSDFTGNNPYSSYIRRAVVRFKLLDQNGKPVPFTDLANNDEKVEYRDVPIVQVRRVENPKAIYRAHNNNSPFHVVLMHRTDKDYDVPADSFEPFESDGPWRASIMACSSNGNNFVTLTTPDGQSINKEGEYIYGKTGSVIDFTYTPTGSCGANETKCAIILVEYHDYTCNHMIFVRWGYNKGVTLGNANWSLYQVYAAKGGNANSSYEPEDGNKKTVKVVPTQSPLSIGSFLKRCQYNWSIREASSAGWLDDVTELDLDKDGKVQYDRNSVEKYKAKQLLSIAQFNGTSVSHVSASWSDIQGFGWYNYGHSEERYTRTWADIWEGKVNGVTKQFTVPTVENFKKLQEKCDFGFGIAYADGATETAKLLTDAYEYRDDNNSGVTSTKGMRVCVAYDSSTGLNILFPIGASGHGRRTADGAYAFSIPNDKYGFSKSALPGAMSYGGMATVLWGDINKYRPITYNHYRTPGALYWVKTPQFVAGKENDSFASWDINYFTLTFNNYAHNSLAGFSGGKTNATKCSDALPIKLIYVNAND